ncbi:hypothetical protein ACWD04_21015 [Streptomyces sp. NPDC002911]
MSVLVGIIVRLGMLVIVPLGAFCALLARRRLQDLTHPEGRTA